MKVHQFITETDCGSWKYQNVKHLTGRSHKNSSEILYQGWANECPAKYLENIVFKGDDHYLLILKN